MAGRPCHPPLQFYPAIAVDQEGRVGVLWYDTRLDYGGALAESDPCDGAMIYATYFSWSLDGGVTWEPAQRLGDEVSILGFGRPAGDGTWDQCTRGFNLGEYGGLTATTDDQTGDAVFHAVWTDLRMYTDAWRLDPDGAARSGDIFSDKYTVTSAVYSMGDFDRDYDVDMNDFANFSTCGVGPLPAECEILDMNRSNEIDNIDPYLFMQNCFTGPVTGGEAGAGGASESDQPGEADPLDEMVIWCMERMSAHDRSKLARSIREAAATVDSIEAARMITFANAIDPVE